MLVVILLLIVKFSKEGFLTDEKMHDEYSLTYQKKYNNVGIALAATESNGTNNVGVLGSNTRELMGSVQDTMDDGNTITQSIDNPYPLEEKVSGMSLLIKKCEAVKTSDCSIFDNSDFTSSCGVCIADPTDMGTNSEGAAWTGGLVLTAKDREYGKSQQKGNFLAPYSPTVGTCPAGRMVATKGECLRLQNQLACTNNATLGSPEHCSQCFSDGIYHLVEPNQVVGAGVINVVGSGTVVWSEGTSNSGIYDLTTTSYPIAITGGEYSTLTITLRPPRRPTPYDASVTYSVKDLIIWRDYIYRMQEGAGSPGYNPDREGDRLWVRLGPRSEYVPPPPAYIAGYLEGPDGDNTTTMDLYRLILSDTLTGRKPRTSGQIKLDSVDVTKMSPGFGQTRMNFIVRSPFSFVDPTSQEASVCTGSPFVTKAASATLLNSDPCYAKGSGPGKYNLECLQQIFQNNGCGLSEMTLDRSGFPATNAKAAALLYNGDKALTTDEIANDVYQAALSTATGLDSAGNQLKLADWSKVSQFCTGVAINSPCDLNAASGPLTSDCIVYLWDNQGENKMTGSTYSLSSLARSLFSSGRTDRFCTRQGSKAPKDISDKINNDNMDYWKSFGGVAAVKAAMSALHLDANTSLTNEEIRAPSILQCYGIIPNDRPLYKATYKGVSETKKLSSNTVLKDNITLPDDFDYYLSFDITPYGIIFGNHSSIIRITNTSTQLFNRGDRNPLILFAPNTTVPYIVLGDNEALNWWGSGDLPDSNYYPALPINVKSTITIKTTGKSVMVTVAGKSNNYTQPSKRQSGSGYKFYASDNFFPPANALIENIMYKVNDTVILETPPAPPASTGPGQSL